MIEELCVSFILLEAELITEKYYREQLDSLFLHDLENELILNLEFAYSNLDEVQTLISEYFFKEKNNFDYEIFGKILLEEMSKVYKQGLLNINVFCEGAYRLWCLLPEEISDKEPFLWLVTAGDCLSYGDEFGERERFDKIFSYDWK